MKSVLLAAVLLLVTAPAMSTEMKAFTVQDLVTLERISDPRVSPDGHSVAYVVRETDLPNNKGIRNIWLLDLGNNKGAPRKLTGGMGSNDTPRWSPDGTSLYFSSTRSGSAQIWRLDMNGGEAQQITNYPLDINAFVLSPDGQRIALSMDVFADCSDLASTKKRLDDLAAKKSTGTVFNKLFVRHWDAWSNGTRAQLFVADLDSRGIAAVEPRLVSQDIDGDVPSKPFGDDSEFSWSPDSKTLAFDVRIAGTTEAWSTNLDIYTVPADGSSKPVNHTLENLATDISPLFTPDGQSLIYKAMKRPTFEADRLALTIVNLKTGAKREIAPSWDRSADAYSLSTDGKTIYCTADDLGQKPLFAIDVATGTVNKLTGEGTVSGFSLGKAGIVYALNSLQSPDQLYRIAHDGGTATQLTQTNAEQLSSIQLASAEQFHFSGWNNETVYGYVVKPWNYQKGKKYPTTLIIHGGPQGSMGNDWHYRWNPQTYAAQGYAVVFIDFHGSTGYGQAFTDSISGDWGGKPLEDLQKGWKYALEKYDFLDSTKAAALGASYGGYMINWIAGNWQDTFKCLVNHDGVFDNRFMTYSTEELWFDEWEQGGVQYEKPENFEKHNPINFVKNWKTPMLVIHSAQDFRVTQDQGIAAFTALQRRGIPSQLLTFPDENHWVLKPQNSIQWHDTVNAWLKKWISN